MGHCHRFQHTDLSELSLLLALVPRELEDTSGSGPERLCEVRQRWQLGMHSQMFVSIHNEPELPK